jgi:urease accessory protein
MTPALLLLADGRFPAGGHAYSAGTESAVTCGDVHDLASLERYLAGKLATTGVVDAAFAASACRSGSQALDAEYEARLAAPRSRVVSRQMGRQLLRAARAVWPGVPAPDHHAPIALGLACAAAGGAPDDAARLAIHHLSAAICTAAVRMLGLDPLSVAAAQARAAAAFVYDPAWATAEPAELPALTGTMAEILAEDHGRWDARLFVA